MRARTLRWTGVTHSNRFVLHRFKENGGRTWARTKDPLIKSQLLYQLSYASIPGRFLVAPWCGAPLLEARC
ncbi:hypothetical protein SPHINGO391_530053 [Sphingomonas aurantiaca]|uniref:Uncharacterized protein n=1 Tax=Sphingomonas aurantiaca TaxID=185949 RepID=A0A5E8AQL7_9SPHN|nr:hypothetical protein SPHINGO391_530053 [Sphingomonas aurantiaca]